MAGWRVVVPRSNELFGAVGSRGRKSGLAELSDSRALVEGEKVQPGVVRSLSAGPLAAPTSALQHGNRWPDSDTPMKILADGTRLRDSVDGGQWQTLEG